MTRPVFNRVDLAMILPDGTKSETIVVYHDGLLKAVLEEAAADAKKIGATLVLNGKAFVLASSQRI